jgi:predicted metal-binding membrane protein
MTTARASGGPGPRAQANPRQALLAAILGALTLASWAVLWWWSASPYAGLLYRAGGVDTNALAQLGRWVPQGETVVPAVLHASAFVLMLSAMMLPTTYPLLAMFRRITGGRPDGARLALLVVGGFLAVWFAFGLVAHALDDALRALAARSAWLTSNGDVVAAGVLAAAGLFQFSALKYRCLEQCHAPFGFVSARWHGRAPSLEAFRLGVDHGVFCVGCCWALMTLMFVVGVGNVGWMLALAVVMAAEKNLPWGRRLRTPLGIGLIGWAAALLVLPA